MRNPISFTIALFFILFPSFLLATDGSIKVLSVSAIYITVEGYIDGTGYIGCTIYQVVGRDREEDLDCIKVKSTFH